MMTEVYFWWSNSKYVFLSQKTIVEKFSCGADFLPSPLASQQEFALKANSFFTRPNLLTAVAVAEENDHTIAFLGHNPGEVIKVRSAVLNARNHDGAFLEPSFWGSTILSVTVSPPCEHMGRLS